MLGLRISNFPNLPNSKFHQNHQMFAKTKFFITKFLWSFRYYTDWNETGVQSSSLFFLAILFTVLKSIFSYMLLLVASLGWGVTRPYLDKKLISKIKILIFLYSICDFLRQFIFADRSAKAISKFWSTISLLPIACLNGLIFYWIFHSLKTLIEVLGMVLILI